MRFGKGTSFWYAAHMGMVFVWPQVKRIHWQSTNLRLGEDKKTQSVTWKRQKIRKFRFSLLFFQIYMYVYIYVHSIYLYIFFIHMTVMIQWQVNLLKRKHSCLTKHPMEHDYWRKGQETQLCQIVVWSGTPFPNNKYILYNIHIIFIWV